MTWQRRPSGGRLTSSLAISLHLSVRSNCERSCSYESRSCLHSRETGALERDAAIFDCERSSGSWRLRGVGEEAELVCRLEATGESGMMGPGTFLRMLPLAALAEAVWLPPGQSCRKEQEAHWKRWGLTD